MSSPQWPCANLGVACLVSLELRFGSNGPEINIISTGLIALTQVVYSNLFESNKYMYNQFEEIMHFAAAHVHQSFKFL